MLFADRSGQEAQAQIEAFDDTWTWSHDSEAAFDEMVQGGVPPRVADAIEAMRRLLGDNDVLAYLVMMTPRLVELHRTLKPTGSLWLHCDTTASHYLKIMLDAVFGPKMYRNEVTWRRTSAHSDQGQRRFGKVKDVILFYSRGPKPTFNVLYTSYTEEYLEHEYRHKTPSGRYYKEADATAQKPGGDVSYVWRVKRGSPTERWQADLDDEYLVPMPGVEYKAVRPYDRRYWAYSKENLKEYARQGKLIHRSTGMPRVMLYADEMPGIPLQDIWSDIWPATGREDLGYPTQKPEALLERIIQVGSNEGDVVLDPFCGCGTTVAVAQRLRRRWIGIDITFLAVDLIDKRLRDVYGDDIRSTYDVRGIPRDLGAARALFDANPFDFERWAVSLVDGQPHERHEQAGDHGVDGWIRFPASEHRIGRAVVSVKGGRQLNPAMVRDLRGTVESQRADMGILITLDTPTRGMVEEARRSGTYKDPLNYRAFPRVQIVAVAQLLAGTRPDMPTPFLPYVKAKHGKAQQDSMGF